MTTTSLDAVRAVAARDRALAPLALVLDHAALSDALDRDVTVTRLRYKRGSSVVAAFDGPDGPGWLGAYTDPVKVRKALSTARRAGAPIRTVHGQPQLVVGGHDADRALARPLARLRSRRPEVLADARLVRHNPQRRLLWSTVVDDHRVLLKLAADDRRAPVARTRALAASGAPVVASELLTSTGHVEFSPWWGTGELTATSSAAAAHRAGEALAAVHSWEPDADLVPHDLGAATALVHGHVLAITDLLPELHPRLAALVDPLVVRLTQSREFASPVPVHGDFSTDQVLVDGDDVRIIDLDRMTWDVPARDLGSLLAAARLDGEEALAASVVDGYTTRRGHPGGTALDAWQALSLLGRAVEPFRQQRGDWAAETVRRVALTEEVLG